MNITLTDVTHLHGQLVCLAGLTNDGLTTIRPLVTDAPHYLTIADCTSLDLVPGTVIEISHPAPNISRPHIEDRPSCSINVVGRCSGEIFESLLDASAVTTFAAGFGVSVTDKCIPLATVPTRSIITLKTTFANLTVMEDNYGKVRAHVRDAHGVELRFLPVNDLGICDHVGRAPKRATMDQLNGMIADATNIYVRLGISRQYATNGRDGFWVQVNGIYTFPNHLAHIREH